MTKAEALKRIRGLETDRRLLLEVASPEGLAVIRAAIRWRARRTDDHITREQLMAYSRAIDALMRAVERLLKKRGKR